MSRHTRLSNNPCNSIVETLILLCLQVRIKMCEANKEQADKAIVETAELRKQLETLQK